MDSSINYILDKKELQTLLKRTVEIKKYKSGYVQFVTKGVKDFIYYSFNIADILIIKVNKTHRAITKLKNAITDDNESIIIVNSKPIRVHWANSYSEELFEHKPKRVYTRLFGGCNYLLKDEDRLRVRFKNGMPHWLNYGKNNVIRKKVFDNSKNILYHNYQFLFDKNIKGELKYTTNILRPVKYINGYDFDKSIVDFNSIYYFRKKSTIQKSIDKLIVKIQTSEERSKCTEAFNELADYLFNEAFALFYCNLSWGRFTMSEYQKYGIEIIWYLICILIKNTGAMDFSTTNNKNADWLPDIDIELLFHKIYDKVQCSKSNWSSALRKITRTDLNKCLFPAGYTKAQKEAWKVSKGIERKVQDKSKRKVQDKSKRKKHDKSREQINKENSLALEINKLKGDGLSIRKIAQQMNISVSTVKRYLSKGL